MGLRFGPQRQNAYGSLLIRRRGRLTIFNQIPPFRVFISISGRLKSAFALLVVLGVSLACQTVLGVNELNAPNSQIETPLTIPQTERVGENQEPAAAPTIEDTYDLSKDDQLDIFDRLWEIVNADYLYSDFNGLDWDAVFDEVNNQINAGLSDQEFYILMDDTVIRLGDEHSVFLDPDLVAQEEAEYEGDNNYVGVGILVRSVPERDRMVILVTFPGSPADQAGLKAHDSILAVDGQAVLDEEGFINGTMLGEEGTEVVATVQTPGEEPRDVTMIRSRINGVLPVPYHTLTTPDGGSVGYILIPNFVEGSVDDQVRIAIQEMSEAAPLDGLILDNRINSGGFDNVMSGTLRYFVEGLVGHFVNRQEEDPLRIRPRNVDNSRNIPLVVLVGKGTVSFGEVFSGVLQDQGRAYLIGETTDGNVEVLWGYDFFDGSRAWIAHDTFRPINNPDADWEFNGIIPDLEVIAEWDQFTLNTDPAISAALAYLDSR